MSNDFNYINLPPFKWFVLENFPFIEADFDALTNWQLFCKLGKEINKIINSENQVGTQVENLTNYFNNLDVQEEINNKLDEMAKNGDLERYIISYLQPYFDEQIESLETFKTQISQIVTNQNNEITNFENQINSTVNTQNEKINNITSGAPAGVYATLSDLQTADPDHDKIYIVSATGKWYYYGNSQWNEGGTYQSTAIADGSVTYNNLDSTLKGKIDIFLNKKQKYIRNGYYWHTTNHEETAGVNYALLKLPISASKGYVLECTSSSMSNIVGQFYNSTTEEAKTQQFSLNNLTGVTDRNIVTITRENNTKFYSIIAKNSDYDYYYLNIKTPSVDAIDIINVYDYDEFMNENVFRYINQKPLTIRDYKNRNIALDSLLVKGYIYTNPAEQYPFGTILSGKDNQYRAVIVPLTETIHIYSSDTQATWYVYAYDKYLRNPERITDYETVIINNKKYYHKEVNTISGKAFVGLNKTLSAGDFDVIVTKEAINTSCISEINNLNFIPKSTIKNWFCLGDSITNKNYRALVNYVDYCLNDLNIKANNLAVSGAGYNWGTHRFSEQLTNISNYNIDTDIITVMGSVNDINHLSDMTIGEIGDTGTDTLYGVLYNFYTDLFTDNLGARVGIILPIPSKTIKTVPQNWSTYNQALKDTAKMFNIPVLDLTDITNLRPWEEDFRTEFYTADGIGNASQVDDDGIHPNSKGHKLFYARVKEFIKSL